MLKLKLLEIFINLWLIIIIFIRIPEENTGLTSFATKSNILGSPKSARRFLNFLTFIGILIYFGIAIKFNLLKT